MRYVQQNNYVVKIVNAYILCDIGTCPRNPTSNFEFKNCLFGATDTFYEILLRTLLRMS